MATGAQWINYFKKLSPARKARLKKALDVVESEAMIKKEFGWTGLFSLKHLMRKN